MFRLSKMRKHVTPSTLIALVALVFAATGGAFAATGGGTSHPILTASIAKKSKKKSTGGARGPAGPKGATGATGPAGPAGATGPAGPAGAAGAKGENGAAGSLGPEGKGTPGTNGTNGESVTVAKLGKEQGGCKEGGAKFSNKTGEATACNGEGGSGGGFPETLPEGKTETGVWSSEIATAATDDAPESYEYRTISFPIQLSEPIAQQHAVFVTAKEQKEKSGTNYGDCGGSVEEPKALEGFLCIYQGVTVSPESTEYGIYLIGAPGKGLGDGNFSAGRAGAVFVIRYKGEEHEHEMMGSWAVTAE
jgi:hypothetical protein